MLPEILDHAAPEEATETLPDLVKVNRYFGGYRVLRKLLGEVARPDESFSLLDVGSASGDMGAALRERFPRALVTSIDYRWVHLANASPPKLVADAFALPFAPRSFDFVFTSLFLHHFSNQQVVDLLRAFRTIARRAVLAIDLERGPIAYYFMPATRWLFGWSDISMHDGPASVASGFKKEELAALAAQAGLTNAIVRAHRPWARLTLLDV